MKTISRLPFALIFSLLLSAVTHGSIVIAVSDLSGDGSIGSITADLADISGSTTTTPSTVSAGTPVATSQTMQFDITGLTIDGSGSGDDSISFSILVEAWGGTISASGPSMTLDTPYYFSINTSSRWGNSGASGSTNSDSVTSINAGEALSFSFAGGSVELGSGGSGGYGVSLDGFSQIRYDKRGSGAAESVLELDGVYTLISNPDSDQDIDLQNATTFGFGEVNDTTGYFRLEKLDFGLTVQSPVPEASISGVLTGASILFMVLGSRRRRNHSA